MNFKIDPPKINERTLSQPRTLHSLADREEVTNCIVSDCLIEYQEATRVACDKVIFRNVTIAESALPSIELTDVIFENCDLSNVNFSEAFIHRTEFRRCKMLGTDFSDARLQNVRLIDCLADFANFRMGSFKQVAFESSSLISSDFYRCGLNSVAYSKCNIDQTNLAGCKLKDIDLSDCDFTGFLVDIPDLQGCVISAGQAAAFAGLLGLVIK
ncbi:pentapeptide repeat-containing protein ['Paenibacillus yunnanensis' Narsing Rao et al. 2020]|uniref:pentapeptide repeat-containing protein n=1 Tax=Paenibacillus tengchongensis TaxID=2608684 RepID=UPI00124F3E9C|nr:pentapeptide repeat-containing protein [Paenibacillus tengchongensis]